MSPSSSAARKLAQIRDRIAALERPLRLNSPVVSIASEIDAALPQGGLPTGSIHEIRGSRACAIAFSAMLAARTENSVLIAAPERCIFPVGLLPYGLTMERVLLFPLRRPADVEWVVTESLRCTGVGAVIASIPPPDLTMARKLQLAAESSGATGFLLSNLKSRPAATVMTRWRVTPAPGNSSSGFAEPAWNLELVYCRHGRPGRWRAAWTNSRLWAVSLPETAQSLVNNGHQGTISKKSLAG